nr:GTPase [Arthrobacter sp.]
MAIRTSAQVAIHTASVAAAGVSASPIPFSDSALLVPIQTTMIIAIYKAYDQEVSEGFLQGALKATAASAIGKGIAGNLLKMIPVVGTVAGGVINAGISVAFTEAIGFGVANAFENSTDDNSLDILAVLRDIAFNFKKKK